MTHAIALRMFMAPALLAASAPCVALLLGWMLPSLLHREPTLVVLADLSQQAAGPAVVIVLAAALILSLGRWHRWRQWRRGDGLVCRHCGGPVAIRDVGYGLYHACYGCGAMTHA